MIKNYIERITTRYKTGISREHSYRGDLQNLLEALAKDVLVTNEPARIACGAPDYILTRGNIPIGYIEAKDIGVSLAKVEKSDQMKRYTSSLDNVMLTDYLDFRLYRQGKFVTSVALAEIKNNTLVPLPENWQAFEHFIQDFCLYAGQTISSAQKLAEMMAGKARMMQTVIEQALQSDEKNEQNSSLNDQMVAFKRILIHDITPGEFADIYAQTIAYGMFAARLHDPSLDDFSRQEAAGLIPKTNPFLRKLFSYIAGVDIDDRITWIVDALADIFRATDVTALMENFGKSTQMNDPVIHFYETFLAKYNPKLRKSRGVWYTPEPVVNFIVRAVDDILQVEFGLSQGLADTSKTTIEVDTQVPDKRSKTGYKREKQEVHKVQILDPAAGTGTFLAEVIKQIYKKFAGQQGIWSNYVEEHLIPRLHGFEILMASYAMTYLKLELLLRETGYTPKTQQRFRVFLTNSLEEAHPDTGTLFASWLSREAIEANYIKRDTPVMVVLGNPPYSVSSSNKGEWIQNLLADYKKDLNEKNINPLSDDYIKFIRYGQYFIEKNGEGILAYISNNSFIDGIIHRQMRKHLLESFDKIYILDLHGNSKRKEICPDGSPDQNVFDITQGVSINIFVKTGKKKKNQLGDAHSVDLWGKREGKYETLVSSSMRSLKWKKLAVKEPNFFLVKKVFEEIEEYQKFFSVAELFPINSNGIVTDHDSFVIDFQRPSLSERIQKFFDLSFEDSYIEKQFSVNISGEGKLGTARRKCKFSEDKIEEVTYRLFDTRFVYYESLMIGRERRKVMRNILQAKQAGQSNIGLVTVRQTTKLGFTHVFCSKEMIEKKLCSHDRATYFFPLYRYPENTEQTTIGQSAGRTPNLNRAIVEQIHQKLGIAFTDEKPIDFENKDTFAPIDILDYIYAVLHSPTYRETYKEFLKIDFPRIPYPKDQETFWQLVKFGGELRQLHLLESPKVEEYITTYPQDGDNTVTRKITQKDYEITDKEQQLGRVWINDGQYFDKVPQIAWEFYIGGYQPAQKWLKDRRGRQLNFDDILHYQKIIVALTETDRIMKEIDKIDF